MATNMATTLHSSGTAVVGYFVTGSAAHQAIDRLIADGFSHEEIGAAFHVGAHAGAAAQESGQPDVGGSLREGLGTTQTQSHLHSGGNFGGATSTDNDVQIAALGGGAGAPVEGAARPGPISGSSLANTGLPSELKSSLPHDAAMPQRSASEIGATQERPVETTPVLQNDTHESWVDKLKHVFTPAHTAKQERAEEQIAPAQVTRESQAFGTGEGHLMLPNRVRYSQPGFESTITHHGVPPEHSRYLSERIGHGGAIVTVHAGSRSMEAERILESAGAEVRFSADRGAQAAGGSGNVEIFGTFESSYPERNV